MLTRRQFASNLLRGEISAWRQCEKNSNCCVNYVVHLIADKFQSLNIAFDAGHSTQFHLRFPDLRRRFDDERVLPFVALGAMGNESFGMRRAVNFFFQFASRPRSFAYHFAKGQKQNFKQRRYRICSWIWRQLGLYRIARS